MHYHFRDCVWKRGVPYSLSQLTLIPITTDFSVSKDLQHAIQSIQFVGDPKSKEVKAIVEQNEKEKTKIKEIYSLGNFLEITLQQLTEE